MTKARSRKAGLAGAALAAVAGFTLAAMPAAPATASTVGAAACGGNVPSYTGFYTYAYGDCSILGGASTRVSVRWDAYGGSSGFATLEVRGFRNGTAYWQKCGAGSGTCVVDWGSVGARLQVRAKSTYGASSIYFYY